MLQVGFVNVGPCSCPWNPYRVSHVSDVVVVLYYKGQLPSRSEEALEALNDSALNRGRVVAYATSPPHLD